MPEEQLKKAVDDYILANNTCTLATGFGEFVRCTPIEYYITMAHSGCFPRAGKNFMHWSITKMSALPFMINMNVLEN